MAKKPVRYSGAEKKLCPSCAGVDGKPKEIYDNRAQAEEAKTFLSSVNSTPLYVYQCPYGAGFHLTKKPQSAESAGTEIIPKEGSLGTHGSWRLEDYDNVYDAVYDNTGDNADEITVKIVSAKTKGGAKKTAETIPVSCEFHGQKINVTGKIRDIVANINLGKKFGVDTGNAFVISNFRDILPGPVTQFSLITQEGRAGAPGSAPDKSQDKKSYTILANADRVKTGLRSGGEASITIKGIIVNKIAAWVFVK